MDNNDELVNQLIKQATEHAAQQPHLDSDRALLRNCLRCPVQMKYWQEVASHMNIATTVRHIHAYLREALQKHPGPAPTLDAKKAEREKKKVSLISLIPLITLITLINLICQARAKRKTYRSVYIAKLLGAQASPNNICMPAD